MLKLLDRFKTPPPVKDNCLFAVRIATTAGYPDDAITFRLLDNAEEAHRLQAHLLSLSQQDIMVGVDRVPVTEP